MNYVNSQKKIISDTVETAKLKVLNVFKVYIYMGFFLNFNTLAGCLGLTSLHIINFILKKMQMIQLDARDKIKFHGQLAEFGT